jgi:hypothetical protein
MLFNQYAAANPKLTDEVVSVVTNAIVAEIDSCLKKAAEVKLDLEKSDAERVGEAKLLEKRAETASLLLKEEKTELFRVGSQSKPLLDRAKDALSLALDSKLKG